MKHQFRNFSKTYIHYRYSILFYSLLLTFAAAPLLAVLRLPSHLLQIFLGINLAMALASEHKFRSSRFLALSLLLLILGRAMSSIFQLDSINLVVLPLLCVFALATVITTVRSALRSDKITDQTLFAALSGYILAGLCMAFIYWTIEQFSPGSFVVSDSLGNKPFSLAMAVYFSFVTLATLGYGDIVPADELTRGLVILECIAGQLYLVVMVARLVSLYREREH